MPIARPQWPMFREVLRRQELMDDMMERCGVDVLDVIRKDRGQPSSRRAPRACALAWGHAATGCSRLAAMYHRLRISVPMRISSAPALSRN